MPLVHANLEDEIYNILLRFAQDPTPFVTNGEQSKTGYEENAGSKLVDKYIAVIQYLAKNKKINLKHTNFKLPPVQSLIGPDNIH